MLQNLPDVTDRIAGHFTAGQTAALSGAGSAAAITAAITVDSDWTAWLQVATLGIGLLSGLGGLVVVTMKVIQQRREMRHWMRKMYDK